MVKRLRRIKKCLRCKMIIGTTLMVILSLGGFFYLHIQKDREHLMTLVRDEAYRMSNIILKSVKHDMLRNQRSDIQQTVDDITGHDDIIKIRIIQSGKIKIASDKSEIGQVSDKKAETCNKCHGDSLSYDMNYRIFKDTNGRQVMNMMNPIYNEKSCYPCHGDRKRILGVLEVVISLDRVNAFLMANRSRVAIFLLFTFILIALTVNLLIRHFVANPIKELTRGTDLVTSGHLDHQIHIDSVDEIGDLARSFNIMTSRLKASREEVEKWSLELEDRVRRATAELAAANKELESANQKLRESDRKKSEMMMAVAHDIRSPLAAIKSCLRVVLDGYLINDPAKEREMIQRVEARIEDQITFVRHLLDFSQVAKKKQEIKELNLSEVIGKVADLMSQLAMNKDISLEVQKEDKLPVLGDEELLIRALTNLVGNAIKYSSPESKILVTGHRFNGHIQLAVKDNGHGIPADELPKIFDVLFRGRDTKMRKEQGVGLGLSIVKQVVEIHKGDIRVESKEEEGTSFFITLPRL